MMWGTLRRWLRRLRSHDLVRDYKGSNIESDENRVAKRPGCQSRKHLEFEAYNTFGAPKEKDNGFSILRDPCFRWQRQPRLYTGDNCGRGD